MLTLDVPLQPLDLPQQKSNLFRLLPIGRVQGFRRVDALATYPSGTSTSGRDFTVLIKADSAFSHSELLTN